MAFNGLLQLLAELLCFYLILDTMKGKNIKKSLFDLMMTKQWVKWGNILAIVIHVGSVLVLRSYNNELGIASAAVTIPIMAMYLARDKNVYRMFLAYFLFFTSGLALGTAYIFASINIFTFLLALIGSHLLLIYFEVPYKIWQWIQDKKLIKRSLMVSITLLMMHAILFGPYTPFEIFMIVCIAIVTTTLIFFLLFHMTDEWKRCKKASLILRKATKEELHNFLLNNSLNANQQATFSRYDFCSKTIEKRLENEILQALKKHQLRCHIEHDDEKEQFTLVIHEKF